jgi:hypothetical protein
MSATILKGPVHQAIDELVNEDATKHAAFLEALKGLEQDKDCTEAYLEILKSHTPKLRWFSPPPPYSSNYLDDGYVDYLLDYLHDTWYNPSDEPKPRQPRFKGLNGFWPIAYHPTEPIIRQGLIAAIELATQRSLPLESYWINTGNSIETIVICNPQQVTRIIMTPPSPPAKFPDILMNFADIRIIKHGKAVWEDLEPPNQIGGIIRTKLKTLSQDDVFRQM